MLWEGITNLTVELYFPQMLSGKHEQSILHPSTIKHVSNLFANDSAFFLSSSCYSFINHAMILWLLWTTKTNLKIHHTVECDVALNVKCFHSLSTSFSDLDYQTKEDKINQYDKAWATIVSIKVITPNNCVGHLNCFCFCFKLRSKQFRIKTVDDT